MIPRSGFYGLIDTRGHLQSGDFTLPGLPPPRPPTGGTWLGIWTGGPLDVAVGHAGDRWLAFHGALYNRYALCRQLDLPDNTSTEQLLLLAWTRWPDNWMTHLDGLYALAQWTDGGRDLTLHRDASGALGLFHARTRSGGIAFSSHLGTLVRLPDVKRRLAGRGLHEYLRLLDIAAPNTIFEGVRAVPVGEGLILDALRPEVETVLPTRVFPPADTPFDEAVTELESHLSTSIGRRLEDMKHPAAFLSGGVDSALICALASRQRPDLETVTVGFEGAAYDETPIAQAISGHLGLQHHVLRFERADFVGALAHAGRHAEQPMADPAEPATLLAFERVKQTYDIVLDGTGADEQIGAMPPRHVRVAVAYAASLPAGLRRGLVAALPHLPGLAGYLPVFDFEHPAETMMRWHGFRREEIEALCDEPVSLAHTRFHEVFAQFPRTDHYARYSALMEALPCDRLSQAALITGLNVGFPFWNPEVEACLRGQPLAHRWRQDDPKRILRAVLARHVPRNIWDAPKHSFDFPLMAFLCAEDFEVVRRYLQHGRWTHWQILSPDRVTEYGRRFIAGEHGLRFRVWALVVLAAWLEAHHD